MQSGSLPKSASREAQKLERSGDRGLSTNPVLILNISVIVQLSFQMMCV